ncbi:MAG: hypothetical protein A3D24_00975 [Candidatus Blackburnbacteria bacterium RIFCSPHIGHO2_02_FULL_39_13]|uniref:Uncharacterized protein n=1 Tax=Candidatus Blackburnbacteria bacterium RIFCSPLOWO2_01_FULL_40_20 TaxID=1797519 RepID=A0A1G1VD21_9BACT|nr:MAG: hypothetical protein A2694_00980 [Candidatus Blackburnbacteria bacterium RIFCSPHIGHO2_01_FULL_40_17]OGY08033.1 MAG: hypothetical protein A3D24_00975 [Candidatus Blackburnbacteria bacterium RIFCSPHIGHO2_02_FULL_39_13]OGY13156.1 MAG: hypothetical protein A3A77_03250 [Candidatus Blackburnbacteria bacterium RIFCSPLOWO2_01_FULL_40_20]OGY15419.1 MAG: hypothetical protein A3I52_01785 [Candidatus Blackburnbacteria bacterium RIFCSPLOWO2_02_FULL_40_10]HBL51897.1 hypothetical protein [Candidatus B
MTIWLIILTFAVVSAAFVYTKRYSSSRRIGSLYFIQFFYLFVLSPAVFISLLNIALNIYLRVPTPEAIDGSLLFSLFALSLAIGVAGNGIHSTSTSVFQAFQKRSQLKAFLTNEAFHGPLSHDMTFAGSLLTAFFLSLLEITRPASYSQSLTIFIFLGILIGLAQAISIIWSTHIGLNLGVSFICVAILSSFLPQMQDSLFLYPIAISMFSLLATTFVILAFVGLSVVLFKSTTKKMVRLLFPTGHPIHESFSFF